MKSYLFVLALIISVAQGQVYPKDASHKDPNAPIEKRVKDLLSKMTLEEKVDLLSGTGFASKPNVRLGIPELTMTDGPVGVRWEKSTAFPAAIMLAATFDTSLAYRYGWALARETKAKDRNTILGPCVNINRVPNGGRNFESYGEDPFLTSRIAVSYIKGVQSEGVVATTKHFAVNNQETDRMTVNVKVDKRALYEIYFPAFKAAVQEGKTEAIMCAYNKLNGPYCSENEMLLNDVLKKEWKFDGLVMSDWGAVHSTEGVARYGLDLEMPGGDFLTKEKLLPLIKNGTVKESIIDDKIVRMLRVMFRMGYFDAKHSSDKKLNKPETNSLEQSAVALDVARSGIVLVKNENALLPLDVSKYKSIAVLGPNAKFARTGGGGSSLVVPFFAESPLDGMKRAFPNVAISYAVGARIMSDVPSIEPQYFFLPNDTLNTNGLEAEYFMNKELRGEPTLRRIDKNIDFRWGGNKPADGFGVDNFSVRWKGRIKAKISGTHEFITASDDGMRLFLNGKLLIDDWNDHGIEAHTAKFTMEAGTFYDITVEFYENAGDAVALLGWTEPNETGVQAAVELARKNDAAVIFAGNSFNQESEGGDRKFITLPENQIELINEVAKVNPKTIVVLNAGAQVTVQPWITNVKALVWAFFPGQEGTQSITEVLTGSVNPSGKLPFTLAKKYEDYPSSENYPGANGEVEYKEGILVGYRYFDTKKIEPDFPFGFGMSYTTFLLSDLKVTFEGKDGYGVNVKIKNSGSVVGSEVVQVYVKDKKPKMLRPEKELKAFAKVSLQAGEEKTVTLKLNKSSFEYYDDMKNAWAKSKGGYTIMVGTSSKDVPLKYDVK